MGLYFKFLIQLHTTEITRMTECKKLYLTKEAPIHVRDPEFPEVGELAYDKLG